MISRAALVPLAPVRPCWPRLLEQIRACARRAHEHKAGWCLKEEVPVDFARPGDYFGPLDKPTGRILVSRHQSATEAPRRKRHERSRDTYFTSRSSAGAGFGVRT